MRYTAQTTRRTPAARAARGQSAVDSDGLARGDRGPSVSRSRRRRHRRTRSSRPAGRRRRSPACARPPSANVRPSFEVARLARRARRRRSRRGGASSSSSPSSGPRATRTRAGPPAERPGQRRRRRRDVALVVGRLGEPVGEVDVVVDEHRQPLLRLVAVGHDLGERRPALPRLGPVADDGVASVLDRPRRYAVR